MGSARRQWTTHGRAKGMNVYDIVACNYEDLQAAKDEMRNRVHKHLISAHSFEHGDGWDKRTQNCAVTWQTEKGNNIDGETAWKWLLDNWRRVKSEIQMDGRLRDQDDGEKVVKKEKTATNWHPWTCTIRKATHGSPRPT